MKKIVFGIIVLFSLLSTSLAAVTVQLRRDTAANWTSNNPTLSAGEVGVETDTLRSKVGNGSTVWTSLRYIGDVAAEVDGSSSVSLTAAQVSSTIVYNTGMGGADVALTLPTAAAGYSALFTVGTAQSFKWGVRAGTNDKIYLLAADGTISTGSDNGYARMTAAQVGQSFACWTIKTDAYDWQCKAISIGTSTFAAN